MPAAPLRAEVHVRRAAGSTRRVSPLSPVAAAGRVRAVAGATPAVLREAASVRARV